MLHVTRHKHANPLSRETSPHVQGYHRLSDNIPKYHNNEGDRFFTGTDSVYDLQGQWKFFAMGSFVNWAEI